MGGWRSSYRTNALNIIFPILALRNALNSVAPANSSRVLQAPEYFPIQHLDNSSVY
ncbi:hypothetical protein M413DRAFT_32816 [Hebeloma cylindrosporum]|uniref:Uncharacterized protein n=1 Tax=Hebeloma cylindrosporum TaxID=76867 RepID=A0A0C2Y1R0_HEBCY|nr:hypothetical protein M413DRAFT_32816 [Hebeloma cylindrosporum h7]